MNIVVAIDTYNDANGCTIATKRLVKELRERGHKVRILGALHEDPSDPDFFKIRGFVMPGAEEAQKNMEFLMGRNDYKIFEKAMEDVDVVLVHKVFFQVQISLLIFFHLLMQGLPQIFFLFFLLVLYILPLLHPSSFWRSTSIMW